MKGQVNDISLRPLLSLIFLALLTVMTGCRMDPNDFSEYHTLDDEGWAYADTLKYNFVPRDSTVSGALSLSLRHTNDYIYSNIYLEVTVADSLSVRRDTLEIRLADDFGRWYGRGIGTDFQVSDTLDRHITLRRPVEIEVRHIMRDEYLKDIEQVGISFEYRN